jgi:hypothetical protein
MKAILEFNLDDADDRIAHLRCVKSLEMALAMWEYNNAVRRAFKEGAENNGAIFDVWEDVLSKYNIVLDEMVI